jgi:hypothetical protein
LANRLFSAERESGRARSETQQKAARLQQALDSISMNAELRRQLSSTATSLVCHYQAIDVLGRKAHLNLPPRDGFGALLGTSATLRQPEYAFA